MTPEETQDEFSIHWIKDIVDEVLERDPDQYTIVTGKSMSGSVHVGFMKEIIIADVIKRELQKHGKRAKTVFISDDYDPIRSFPPSLTLSPEEYMGVPYSDAPDPYGCCESLGAHWTNELVESFPEFGADPEVVLQSKLYKTKEMLNAVRICLRHTETIREILIEFVARDFDLNQRTEYIESMKSWYPASVVCPECGRLQSGGKGSIVPNRVTSYNQETDEVSFKCAHCGHSDTTKLDNLRLKLSWRVDWPAKWYVMNTTCEPAGKDHAVKGGSYDTGLEISQRVFGWSGPVKVPFEWVRLGGKDMGTSRGFVFTPKSWLNIAPPELFRYMILRIDPEKANNIQTDLIPDLVDIYESFEQTFYRPEEVDSEKQELAKILYPLTEVQPVCDEFVPKLSFKFAVLTSQLKGILSEEMILERCYNVLKKQHNLSDVPPKAKSLIPTRLSRAYNWAREYGSEQDIIEVPDVVPKDVVSTMSKDDRRFLSRFVETIQREPLDDDDMQASIFNTAKDIGIKPKRAFLILYRILLSKNSGPRLGPFLNLLGNDWVLERIKSVL
ncbi:MAG: lysine--tRNA ligase [Candidatus Thorarchaeota archaeon]|nr:lysine--tRNA ligase [Candidatus Thorarchaeota archaeon]